MVADTAPLAVGAVLAAAALALTIIGISALIRFVNRVFSIPGVVVHEFAHKQACDLIGVRVVDAVYFRFGDPPGYVQHVQPDSYRASFVISVAPFLVNTVAAFGAFLGLASIVGSTVSGGLSVDVLLETARTTSGERLALIAFLTWFGLSVGGHAFPSTGDANSLWTRSKTEWRRSPLVLLGIPVVLVIYLANVLSWLGADLLYAIGLGVLAFAVVGVPVA